jgi:amino acid permease
MGLLNEIKNFISKWIKNPIVIAIVGYLIYKTLQKYVKKESVNLNKNKIESIQIIKRKANEEVIFDEETGMYAHIIGDEVVETSRNKINI